MKFNKKIAAFLFLSLTFNANAQEIKAEFKKEIKIEKTISYLFDYPENAKGNLRSSYFYTAPANVEPI